MKKITKEELKKKWNRYTLFKIFYASAFLGLFYIFCFFLFSE